MSDVLQKLLDKQKELNDRIVKERCNGNAPKIQDFSRALIHEAVELEDETQWKWWKKKDENKDAMKEELIDIFHFWLSIANELKLTAKDIEDIYIKKNQVNHDRQNNGY